MKSFGKLRKDHFLLLDVVCVTLVVALLTAFAHFFIPGEHLMGVLHGIRTTLYSAASAGCGALLGFVITTTTITEAVMQNTQWEAFKKSNAYTQVQAIYFNTMRWLGVSTLLFLVFLVADTDEHPQLVCEVVSAWLVCVVASRMWRSIHALETLIKWNSAKMQTPTR